VAPRLALRGLTKSFGAFRALDDVDMALRPGEIRGLLGHNGSGKSTLIKCLSGFHRPDRVDVSWNGEPIELEGLRQDGPGGSKVSFVHQTLGLVNELSAVDNLALHAGFRRSGRVRVDWKAQRRLAEAALEPFDFRADITRPLAEATPVERTIVGIAAALTDWDARGGVLVLDEPTAALPPSEVGVLLDIVGRLKRRGASVLYVSHRLAEVVEIADTVTVLRNGRVAADRPVGDMGQQELVGLMLGQAADEELAIQQRTARSDGAVRVQARGITGRYLRGADLDIAAGEIVGLAGLVDAGREELAVALGSPVREPGVSGRVRVDDGAEADVGRGRGGSAGYVPADRLNHGVIAQMTVTENLTLPVLDTFRRRGRLSRRAEREYARRWVRDLDVRGADDPDVPLGQLSGGNQQKVVIGRALGSSPPVLVMLEPTAGVDLAAKFAIYRYLEDRAEEGLSILVSSTDLEDLTALCDRVALLKDGVIGEQLVADEVTESRLVLAMEGI
jgi:ribose transport system ATP-binding protein